MATITMTMPMNQLKPSKQSARAIEGPLVEQSRLIWSYFGYTGLITPWHDHSHEAFNFQSSSIIKFMEYLKKHDISLEAYSTFIFPLVPYERYDQVTSLIFKSDERGWMKKIRKYAKDKEELDYAANLFMKFIQLQVEHYGKASLHRSSILQRVDSTKRTQHLEGICRLIDRIRQFRVQEVDPELWLEEKFLKVKNTFPDKPVYFRSVVNVNALDIDVNELHQKSNDIWREIRGFLGLSTTCEITDGYIPKGWCPSSDDRDEIKKVVRIDGDGHYYYEDGTMRRGKRHYAGNSYLVIKCNPDNFERFKSDWFDARRMTQTPTWEEFSKWGVATDMWDSTGRATNGRGRAIKWRNK